MRRFYRAVCNPKGLVKFRVTIEESDLLIIAEKNLKKEVTQELKKQREILKEFIRENPEFYYTFSPLKINSEKEIIRLMSESSLLTKTGPMASVAGAVAEIIGKKLLLYSSEVIVENGGDIFLKMNREATVGIYAGNSPFSMKIGIKIPPSETPVGIATSSGKIGHSFSYGKADSVTVISSSSTFSDGAATYFGNIVKEPSDFKRVKEELLNFPFIRGILVIVGKELFVWGNIELVSLQD